MKAIEFQGKGGVEVIHLVDAPMPEIRPNDLLIRVHAAGVNRADVLQRKGYYGDRPDYGDSLIPGLEVAGEVVKVGPTAKYFAVGDRVMAIVGGGGYAEYARFDESMAIPIPSKLTYEQAAAIPEVFVTAHEAMIHLGEAEKGDWVLIHAAGGGVGSAAIQLCHALGAHSVFTVSSQERTDRVVELGGDIGVDYKTQDFLEAAMKATDGKGVNVVVDFIGGPYLKRNIQALAEAGRLVQVGALGGTEGTLPIDLVLHNRLRVIGTVMKSRSLEDKSAMVARFRDKWMPSFEAGTLAPVLDSTLPLSETAEAHRRMEASENFGKIVLTM